MAINLDSVMQDIEKWELFLSGNYIPAWKDWVTKRNIVAKRWSLDREKVIILTAREVSRYAVFNLRRLLGLNTGNVDQIVNTRGNTEWFQLLDMATKDYQRYTAMCANFISLERFDKEIQVTNISRK